jgi:hypothetical protein
MFPQSRASNTHSSPHSGTQVGPPQPHVHLTVWKGMRVRVRVWVRVWVGWVGVGRGGGVLLCAADVDEDSRSWV